MIDVVRANKYRIVIAGGGTSGWMCAAALSRFLPGDCYSVTLVESDAIGTVGVGEATIPHIRKFNEWLGVDENEFMRETNATYKLGIQFNGWGNEDSSYVHPFGLCGHDINGVDFHQYWLRLKASGKALPFDQYSFAVQAALSGRFDYPSDDISSVKGEYSYAFHLDATKYAGYLHRYAIARGVTRREGKIESVHLNNRGEINSLQLDNGEVLSGDLFIDCTGFRALMIGDALKVAYENWQHWLPCDRAAALASESVSAPKPYTQAFAHDCGWRWRIPLQHRVGNGWVFQSSYQSDDEACHRLSESVDGDAIGDPKIIHFTTGKRERSWEQNCISVGLSSGFLEPLESTSIYLIQIAIQKLIEFFPGDREIGIERDCFNEAIDIEYYRIRDFLILHYWANSRKSPFWQRCSSLNIPETLMKKVELFLGSGQVSSYREGLFMPASWLAVYLGQGLFPERHDARVYTPSLDQLESYFSRYHSLLKDQSNLMTDHSEAIERIYSPAAKKYPSASMNLYGVKR